MTNFQKAVSFMSAASRKVVNSGSTATFQRKPHRNRCNYQYRHFISHVVVITHLY